MSSLLLSFIQAISLRRAERMLDWKRATHLKEARQLQEAVSVVTLEGENSLGVGRNASQLEGISGRQAGRQHW
jgi:hypothetical protein